MPQIEQMGTFISQAFWLVVTFGVLYLVMWRYALPRMSSLLTSRQERIDEDIRKAEKCKREADKARHAYEEAVAEAGARAQTAIREVRQRHAEENARRMEELEARIKAEAAAAESRIAEARAQATAEISSIAAEAARAATSRLIAVDVAPEAAAAAVRDAIEGRV